MNNGSLRTKTLILKICGMAETTPAPSPLTRKRDAPIPRQSRSALVLQSWKSCFRLCPSRHVNSERPTLIASSPLNIGFCGQSARQCFEEWPRFFVDDRAGHFSISSDFGRNENYGRGNHSMENTFNNRETETAATETDSSETRRQIFEKVRQRMVELGLENPFQPESSVDIVVISEDKSLLFEPQNSRASELLSQHCGSSQETFTVKDCVRVHPVGSHKIIADLTFAGLKIAHGRGA
jgi:hypothetical protein